MNPNKLLQNIRLGWSPFILIAVTTLATIAISIYCLLSGWVIVFQNLFYIPIIIACVYYTKKGFAFSVVLSFIYLFLIIAFTRDSAVIMQALIRIFIFVGVAGVATFLSIKRKQTEEALRKSEERYRGLFEAARDAIYITTQEGEIIDANQSLLDQFGYSKEEVIGLNTGVTYAHPEDRLKFQKEIERAGFVKDYETKLRKKDGTEMECLLTSIVRRNADGNIVGYQGIIRDITERKRMEEEQEKLFHELQDALASIKRLGGLLPICASCKKIRDDKGYWNQIESYIRDHSEAEFSHGICPDCMKKLYPDLVD